MHNNKSIDSNPPAGSLESRLRALPQPRVPADLERRLLATIPEHRAIRPRRWRAATGVSGLLAAACLLVALALSRSDGPMPVANRDQSRQVAGAPNHDDAVPAEGHPRPLFDSSKPPKFAWPLAGARSLAAASSSRVLLFD
ncbi:MAG: hypothetical protein ACREJM_07600 [Candidatus Saccharimonadales bacterium]